MTHVAPEQRPRSAPLWTPDPAAQPRMGRFMAEAAEAAGESLTPYDALWRWSVRDLEGFWSSIWDHFEVISHSPATEVLTTRKMPDARWFPGARLNYAEHALRWTGDRIVVVDRSQSRAPRDLSADDLRDQVARTAAGLRRLGVGRGDRVVAYLPNCSETLVAFLATASLGAIWSSCAPEMASAAVIDRFAQIEPKVLLAVTGYRYGAKVVDRRAEVATIRAALPTLKSLVHVPYLDADDTAAPQAVPWADLVAVESPLTFEPVDFDHPLYVLYSSGTTGVPKAIVHGHGGIVLEHQKTLGLHLDLAEGDRFCWFTTTGWMMWNLLVSGLLVGSTVVLFDGDPGHPDLMTLWRMAAEDQITHLGVSATYLMNCRKADLSPRRSADLSRLRHVGSTGSPLPAPGFEWVHEAVGPHVQLGSTSGGTDVCTAFVGACPLLPVYAGEISGRHLGVDAQAFGPDGSPLSEGRGELVVTAPMPSMPVGLWGDDDGSRLYEAYYSVFPGVWRHGDWIEFTERGSCIISGRSDATLNRGGVRTGTAEFYRVVEALEQVSACLVVHIEGTADDATGRLILFVAPASGRRLDAALRDTIAKTVREQLSPRHVPDEMIEVPEIPRTLSGKKLEVPVKKLLSGQNVEDVASEDALANPAALRQLAAAARGRSG